jgi:transcriptional regulator with XRE-family HTH domain
VQAANRKFFDNFAERISFLRSKRGLTLNELAGGSASTAKSWEQGSLPRTDQWETIAARLGLSVSLVFLGKPTSREDYEFVAKYSDEIGPPPATAASAAVAGAAIPPAPLEAEARWILDEAIRAAASRPERLGWVLEQLRAHLRPPAHWAISPEEEAAARRRYEAFKAKASGDQVAPPSAEHRRPA